MKRLLFLLPLAMAFLGCSETDVAGGPGSITTNGRAVVGGESAPFARVSLRNLDHMAIETQGENDIVVEDSYADDEGEFSLKIPKDGSYRLTIAYNGNAFTQVVDASSKDSLETVELVPTAVMQGELDVPSDSGSVWVGVYGTDIVVPVDENGVFVIPSVPANDSLRIYFVNESLESVLETKSVFFTPTEFVYENYKTAKEIPADTVETEDRDSVDVEVDSVKKVVVLLDDAPATYASVALRASGYIAEKFTLQNSLVKADVKTDSDGKFSMDWPDSGSYRLTVLAGNYSYSGIYEADSLSAIDTLRLNASTSISSKVSLKSSEGYAWVGAYGFDLLIKTDSIGAYVLPAVPAGETLDLYFVHADSSEPFVGWSVKSSSDETLVLSPSKLLYDFEAQDSSWYMSVDTLYKNSTFYLSSGSVDWFHQVKDHLEFDETRNSNVFHAKYNLASDTSAWVLVGTAMDEVLNFAAIDSIEFYAKGSGNIRIALENWQSYSKWTKAASSWKSLDSTWARFVFKPSDLCFNSNNEKDCDESWDSVKDQVRQIHIFPYGGSEFYIDDVKLYGALF